MADDADHMEVNDTCSSGARFRPTLVFLRRLSGLIMSQELTNSNILGWTENGREFFAFTDGHRLLGSDVWEIKFKV